MKFRIEEEEELEQEVSVGSQPRLQAEVEKPTEKEELKFKGEQLTISEDTEATEKGNKKEPAFYRKDSLLSEQGERKVPSGYGYMCVQYLDGGTGVERDHGEWSQFS